MNADLGPRMKYERVMRRVPLRSAAVTAVVALPALAESYR